MQLLKMHKSVYQIMNCKHYTIVMICKISDLTRDFKNKNKINLKYFKLRNSPYFYNIPVEIICIIAGFLDPLSNNNFRRSSKYLHSVVRGIPLEMRLMLYYKELTPIYKQMKIRMGLGRHTTTCKNYHYCMDYCIICTNTEAKTYKCFGNSSNLDGHRDKYLIFCCKCGLIKPKNVF